MARASTDPADARLLELLDADLTDDALHAEALDLLRKHPAMDEARAYVVAQADSAKALLSVLEPGSVRTALESFADIVATRSTYPGRHPGSGGITAIHGYARLAGDAAVTSLSWRRRWLIVSTVKMTSATHTSPKPIQRPAGMSSWNHSTPRANWMIGARYCSSPSATSGTRIAAAPNRISGIAVTMPVVVNSSAWPVPWLAKFDAPVATRKRT